jgi:P-type E1-E2 ATPase
VINVLIGLVQEGKAEKAAAAIKAMLAPTATVVRGGSRVGVPAEDVVPGDVVFIRSGDRVPAGVRLIEIASLQVQEAMLTGESLPVQKARLAVAQDAQLGDRTCLAYGGTLVVYGQATGVVVATGDAAELGRINAMVSGVESASTPLLDALEVFGRWLAALTVVLAVVAFLVAYLARDLAAKEGSCGRRGLTHGVGRMCMCARRTPSPLPSRHHFPPASPQPSPPPSAWRWPK